MKLCHLAAIAGLGCVAGPVFAGPFISAGPTLTDSNISGEGVLKITKPIGFSLSAGYQADSNPLFAEAQYYSSGKVKAKYQGETLASLRTTGFLLSLGGRLALNEQTHLQIRGGRYFLKDKYSEDGYSESDKYKGWTVGAGGEFALSSELGLRADYERPFIKGAKDPDVFKLSLVVRFRSSDRSSRLPPPPSSYSYSPPVASAAPATPATAVTAAFKPGDEALARPGSVLRAAPMESAAVVQNLSPSPLLKLENSIVNATGEWWFVSSDVERGWLRGDELIRP